MLILKARHKKVFFEKIYLSNIEYDVTTSKIPILSLLPRECMSRSFFENFFRAYKANISTDKMHFKDLQFLAVTYDIGVLSCAFDVAKTVVCFSFV